MKRIRLAATVWATALMAGLAIAQVPAPSDVAPAFDVASVKPSDGTARDGWAFNGRGGRFTATNAPLIYIIALAYRIPSQLQRFRIVGDDRLLSRRFHIDARMMDGLSSDEISLRVKSLLAARFGLHVHSEVRQGPVYALVVAHPGKLGPELRPSQHNCNQLREAWSENHASISEVVRPVDAKNRPLCATRSGDDEPPQGSQQRRDAGEISSLILYIQNGLDLPVVDATQLGGNYEWQITRSGTPRPDSPFPSLVDAISEQLGLKLEPRTGPIDVLVIDDIRMATPN